MNRNHVGFPLVTLCALIALFGAGCSTVPDTAELPRAFTGKVVSVHDGDTIVVMVGSNQQFRVRLAEIAAPDMEQAYGTESKRTLADKVRGKTVRVTVAGVDDAGLPMGVIYLGDRGINWEMVAEGAAWQYRRYSRNGALADAERQAREKHLGLWADKNPVPPWVYRNPRPIEPPSEAHPEPLIRFGW